MKQAQFRVLGIWLINKIKAKIITMMELIFQLGEIVT